MQKINIDLDLIKELYQGQGLSGPEIAKQLNVSTPTIYNRLKKLQLKRRSMAEAKGFTGNCASCKQSINSGKRCKKCKDKLHYKKHHKRILKRAKAYREKISKTSEYKEYHRKYAQENKDKIREYKRLNRSKRRAKYREGDFSLKDWRYIKESQNHRCAYCKMKVPLTLDHIIPLCRGGKHSRSNICGACMKCNVSKNSKPADVWLKEVNIYG